MTTVRLSPSGPLINCGGDSGIGVSGPPGCQGEDGEDGTVGVPGGRGADGVSGAAGPPGLQGEDGEDGTVGVPGARGVDGASGVGGPRGLQGEDGENGDVGPPGPINATELGGAVQKTTPTGSPGGAATSTAPTIDHFIPVAGTGSTSYSWSGSSFFTVGAAAKVTYSGPTRAYIVHIDVTYDLGAGISASGVVVSHNDDMLNQDIITTIAATSGAMWEQASGGGGLTYTRSCSRRLVLNPGSTIQPLFVMLLFADSLIPASLTMTFVPS